MEKYTEEELEKKLQRAQYLKETMKRDKAEYDAIADDLKERYPSGTSINAGSMHMHINEFPVWNKLREHEVAVDYPMSEFPEIYVPKYILLKELLDEINRHNPGTELKIGGYCDTNVSLTVGSRSYRGRKKR